MYILLKKDNLLKEVWLYPRSDLHKLKTPECRYLFNIHSIYPNIEWAFNHLNLSLVIIDNFRTGVLSKKYLSITGNPSEVITNYLPVPFITPMNSSNILYAIDISMSIEDIITKLGYYIYSNEIIDKAVVLIIEMQALLRERILDSILR